MNPSKVQARKMVLASLFVLAALKLYKERKGTAAAGQQGAFRTLWGVGVVGLFLSLLADFVPQIAGPFAGLVVLGSLTHGGDQAISTLLGTVSPKSGGAAVPHRPSPAAPSAPVPHTSTHPPP